MILYTRRERIVTNKCHSSLYRRLRHPVRLLFPALLPWRPRGQDKCIPRACVSAFGAILRFHGWSGCKVAEEEQYDGSGVGFAGGFGRFTPFCPTLLCFVYPATLQRHLGPTLTITAISLGYRKTIIVSEPVH